MKKALNILDFDVEAKDSYVGQRTHDMDYAKRYPLDLDLLKLVFNISKS